MYDAVDWLQPLQKISPFYYATAGNPLRDGLNLVHVGIMIVAIVLLFAVAVWTFERRNVAV